MGYKDFEAAHYLCERDGTIAFPLLHGFNVVNVDHEVVFLALIMDFRLRCVSTRHVLDGAEAFRGYSDSSVILWQSRCVNRPSGGLVESGR